MNEAAACGSRARPPTRVPAVITAAGRGPTPRSGLNAYRVDEDVREALIRTRVLSEPTIRRSPDEAARNLAGGPPGG